MSGAVTINGYSVLDGRIHEPTNGPWRAKVSLDLDEELGDQPIAVGTQVTIAFAEGTAFVGTVTRGSVEAGRWIGQIIGGAGGLRTALDPKYYSALTAQAVISDILATTSEVLDVANSDAAVLATVLPRWARAKGEARACLNHLSKAVGGSWRVTRAGTIVVFRAATYTPTSIEVTEIERDPGQGTIEVAPEEDPVLAPGQDVDGFGQIFEVTTTWSSGQLRQLVVLADDSGRPRGKARQLADAMRKANAEALAYSQIYPGKLVKQDPSGEVDVYPDHDQIRGSGMTGVPLRVGVPGISITAKPGERVSVLFEDGDASKPAAFLWDNGSGVLELHIEADVEISLSTASGARFEIDTAGNINAVPVAFVNLGSATPTDSPTLNNLVTAQLNVLKTAIAAAGVAPMDGGATFKAALIAALSAWPQPMGSVNVRST